MAEEAVQSVKCDSLESEPEDRQRFLKKNKSPVNQVSRDYITLTQDFNSFYSLPNSLRVSHFLSKIKQEIYKKLNLHCLHVRPRIYSEYKFGFTSCDYSIKTNSLTLHSLPLTNAVQIFCLVQEHLYCLEGIAHNNSSMWSAEGCSHSTSLQYTHTLLHMS